MTYTGYEQWVRKAASGASPSACRTFALETIRLLHIPAARFVEQELTQSEQELLSVMLAEVDATIPAITEAALEALQENMQRDEVGAIEFHPYLTELLCGLDAWLSYRLTQDARHITRIAIAMVNNLDYESTIDIDNMLGSPAMVEELGRQRRILGAAHPTC